jgi:ATP-dependent Lhr-like helicase
VLSRRWLDPSQAKDLGALDPEAIARVTGDAWPEPRDPDELADALSVLGYVTEAEGARDGWEAFFTALRDGRRATRLDVAGGLWVAADRLGELLAIHPGARVSPALDLAPPSAEPTREDALRDVLRSRMEGLGPTTVSEVASSLGVTEGDVEIAFAALEARGAIFRGSFRPNARGIEWCERRLLARIHRATIDRLRAEIEPVTQQDFVRFLCEWQRAAPGAQSSGPSGVEAVLELLEGFEAPASAWETDILPARVEVYDPSWLDALCLAGKTSWLRRTPSRSGASPVRSTPITLVPRAAVRRWLALSESEPMDTPAGDAERLLAVLERSGASFFDDLVAGSGLVRAQAETALGELVSRGLVGSDGFSGLRALLVPSSRRREASPWRRHAHAPVFRLEASGRWTLFSRGSGEKPSDEDTDAIARVLLRRWGVVFRRVIDREGTLPPWRDLLRAYRRMEGRGEIRGGRFVAGFSGEQYALPEAVGALRALRKKPRAGTLVAVSAADPLNVVGMLTTGRRVPALAVNRVLFRDGTPIAVREGAEARTMDESGEIPHDLRAALIQRKLPPRVRAYLGNAG